jgi:hypothetical protein
MATRRQRLGHFRSLVRLGVRIAEHIGRTMLASVPRPSEAVTEPWRVSIATVVSSHPKVPSITGRFLRRLDKYGSVRIGPAAVGFDDKTIRWNRVIEIRAYPAANFPPSVVVDRESDRVREMLPPIPGRRWIVRTVAGGLVTVATAYARGPLRPMDTSVLLPCEIVYRNVFGRRASVSAGLFAAIVLTLIPESSNSLLATADARGIPVRGMPDHSSEMRAARSHRVRRIAAYAATRIRMT